MSDHEIVWEFHQDMVSAAIACSAPEDAICQQIPDCDCESWPDLNQDAYGYYHTYETEDDDGNPKEEHHRHHQADYCNLVEWLNSGDLLECAEGRPHFEIARTPVDTVWTGDYYEWKPKPA